jgi:hypothetical protein
MGGAVELWERIVADFAAAASRSGRADGVTDGFWALRARVGEPENRF